MKSFKRFLLFCQVDERTLKTKLFECPLSWFKTVFVKKYCLMLNLLFIIAKNLQILNVEFDLKDKKMIVKN